MAITRMCKMIVFFRLDFSLGLRNDMLLMLLSHLTERDVIVHHCLLSNQRQRVPTIGALLSVEFGRSILN